MAESAVSKQVALENPKIIKDLVRTLSKTTSIEDPDKKRSNTLDAVVKLLTALLDAKSAKLMLAAAAGTSDSMGIAGVGASGKGNNQYLPSFNVRTPIVEVELNGQQIYPQKLDLDSGQMVEARLNFESFNISFPMGGVEKSITGTMQLFAKDPKEILIPLDTWNKNNGVKVEEFSTGGFPVLTIKFGWAFSDSTTIDKISKAMSPKLTFIVTNIGMSDPGTVGTTFTLTLQEIGTVVLENSTDDILILSNYPQEQLRVLLEGLLHVRLFTLDDLLYLGEKNNLGPLAGQTPPTSTQSLAAKTPAPAIPRAVDVGAPMTAEEANSLLKVTSVTTPTGFSVFGMPVTQNQTPTVSDATKPAPQNNLQSSTPAYILNASDAAYAEATKTNAVTLASVDTGKTFFTTKPSAAVGINSRTFFTVAKELASQCRCKWYPHDNTDVTKDETETSDATTKLTALANDLKMVRDTKGSTLSAELSTNIRKVFNEQNTDTTTKLEKTKAEQDLITELKKTMARIATRSNLFWVPNVPATWNTTGSAFYSAGVLETGESVPYEPGAFFLLPDVLDDYDIFLQDLPIQYGPGASAFPYFYGSGQNILQTSLNNNPSKLFGEVQTLSVNHSSLIVALAQAAKENLAYAVNGKRMGQLEAAQNFKYNNSVNANNTITREDSSKDYKNPETKIGKKFIAAKKTQETIRGRLVSSRFKGSCGLGSSGTLTIFDPDNLLGAEKSLPNASDPVNTKTGAAQSVTYNIKSRVANFLRYPTQAKITILGDPNLIRLGPGCFELISYYPVQHDNGTITHEINGLTSGIYFVDKIEHSISGGSFITTLNGSKLIDPSNVPSSFTNQVIAKFASSKEVTKNTPSSIDQIKALPPDQIAVVDLTSPEFTNGFLANTLKNIFNDYETFQDKANNIKRIK